MADFQQAFQATMGHEGGYADDPADRGGETYRGVARRLHPGWPGWRIVDRLRGREGFPGSLDDDRGLQRQVRAFYEERFWRRCGCHRIASQPVAGEIFDSAVNMGPARAARFLQEALNLLNRGGRAWEELVVDGWIGARTLEALGRCLRADRSPAALLTLLNVLQGSHYVEIMRRDPSQRRFARGWLGRVQLGPAAGSE